VLFNFIKTDLCTKHILELTAKSSKFIDSPVAPNPSQRPCQPRNAGSYNT